MASSIDAITSGAGGVVTTADNTGVLQLKTAGTTAVTVDASQNVGIGTTSPSAKLDVRTNTTGDTNINIQNDYSGAAYAANLNLLAANTSGSYYNSVLSKNSAGTITWKIDGAGTADTFRISTGSSATERMRINSSGNVGIGTSSQDTRLVVSANTGTAVQRIYNLVGTNTYQMSFHNSTQECGTISTGNNTVGYNSNSDYRLKEDVAPMTGALEKVSLLKPVTYKWKASGTDGQGFIAHELQEHFPDAVSGEKDAVNAEGNPVYQGVDTSFLVATLTAAIQEQQTIINDLKARIETLEAK